MSTLKATASVSPFLKQSPPLFMSEEEFIRWSSDEMRAEWVDGEVEFMNAVVLNHGKLTVFLTKLVGIFADAHDLGDVFTEPYQVRLPKQRRRRSPDVFFVSNQQMNLLEDTQFNGAPDLIIEVLSPDSQTRDRHVKFMEYERSGVKEYWLPDPLSRTFEAFTLNSCGKFEIIPFVDGRMNSLVLKRLYFQQEWVWQLKLPKPAPLVQQMTRDRKKLLSSRKPR